MYGIKRLRLLGSLLIKWLAIFPILHGGDIFLAEESRLRKAILKIYARFEVRFLKFDFWLLNRPIVEKSMLVKRILYLAVAKFMAERFIAGQCMTWDEIETFVRDLPEDSSIAVGPCRCRVGIKACDHPLETDIVILTGTPIWTSLFPDDYRIISKDEAISIMADCRDQGLVQSVFRNCYFMGSSNYFVICNCCGCSCVPIIGYKRFKDVGFHYIPGEHVSVIDTDLCEGCGTCVEMCPFGERVLVDGKASRGACMGCEVCVRFCPSGASRMVKAGETVKAG
jgi:ferredoxin